MTRRFLALTSVVAIFATVALLAPVLLAAQARTAAVKPAAPAKTWTAPRTPDGQPDLQGFWNNSTYTPLVRPKNVTKEFFTQEKRPKL